MSKKFKLSIWIIVLDGMGALLLGIGMVAHFANVSIIPESLQTEGYGIKMMILGGVLYIPALIFIVDYFFVKKPREI